VSTTLNFQAATVLLDIEGTIGSKAFVTEVLYPYSRQHLPAYIDLHRNDPAVAQALQDTVVLSGNAQADPVQTLLDWIAQDRKAPPLKKLQGLIWQRGFEEGAFQGHLYPDAVQAIRHWHDAGIALAIYSSGSVRAQALYFGNSVAGNLLPWFRAHFDTDVGAKVEPTAYARIAQALGHDPGQILFLSDSVAELRAARAAGLQVLHVVREDTAADPQFVGVRDFAELRVERLT
jgi:enolase-phosphatase E1